MSQQDDAQQTPPVDGRPGLPLIVHPAWCVGAEHGCSVGKLPGERHYTAPDDVLEVLADDDPADDVLAAASVEMGPDDPAPLVYVDLGARSSRLLTVAQAAKLAGVLRRQVETATRVAPSAGRVAPLLEHPAWCSAAQCEVELIAGEVEGHHRGEPIVVPVTGYSPGTVTVRVAQWVTAAEPHVELHVETADVLGVVPVPLEAAGPLVGGIAAAATPYTAAAGLIPNPTGGDRVIAVAGLPLPLWDEWRSLMAVPAELDQVGRDRAVVELVRERTAPYEAAGAPE